MKRFFKKQNIVIYSIIIFLFTVSLMFLNNDNETISTNVKALSTKKIEWGIKRNNNHKQPDLGSVNKRIIDELNRNSNGKF